MLLSCIKYGRRLNQTASDDYIIRTAADAKLSTGLFDWPSIIQLEILFHPI